MRIAVTGGCGFIGRRLVTRLAATGAEVASLDLVDPELAVSGVDYRTGDGSVGLAQLARDWQGSEWTLIHLAWPMARGGAWTPQAQAVQQLAGLLDEWAEAGPVRLVMPGSAEEYGLRGGVLNEEDPPVFPLTPYGWAKHAAGELCQSWARRTGRTLFWLRPFIVYGPGQSGAMALPYAMAQARAGQPAEFSDGLQRRDFVYVDDVVEAMLRAATLASGGVQVVNLGRGEAVALREVIEEMGRLLSAQSLWRWGVRPRRAGEPDIQIAGGSRAADLLGWRPAVSWREGVARWVQETLA